MSEMDDLFLERGAADFSECGQYRYSLRRAWGDGRKATFVMLNPSIATSTKDDPTTTRCMRRMANLGYRRYEAVNLFALISPKPPALKASHDPVGPRNDEAILRACETADLIVAAWGAHGRLLQRGQAVISLLAEHEVQCLGVTKQGCPRHPTYLSYDTGLIPFPTPPTTAT